MPNKILKNWSLHFFPDPFKAPEIQRTFLRGLSDGEVVMIPIFDTNDFNPETHVIGGYILDNPHPEYLNWLKANPPERFGYDKPDPLREYAMSFSKRDK